MVREEDESWETKAVGAFRKLLRSWRSSSPISGSTGLPAPLLLDAIC